MTVPIKHRSYKEQAACDVHTHIAELKMAMDVVLSYVDQAKLVPDAVARNFDEIQGHLRYALFQVKDVVIPTPAQKRKEAEWKERQKEMRARKSEIQTCVDEWLKELVEKFALNPALLEDKETVPFEYEITEKYDEYRSGQDEFTVPDTLKERLEALIEEDFKDALKEHLDDKCHGDFYIETEYGDGELIDSSSELR